MEPKHLEIDLNRLEQEWLNQPLLYNHAADNMANEMRQRDEVKTDLETMLAEKAQDIRNNPDAYGLSKVTEASVQEVLQTNADVIRSKKLLNHFNYTFQKAKNDIASVETKKKALEYEVQLYIGQYFSVPREHSKSDISFDEKAVDQSAANQRRKLGKFSNPITSQAEKDSIPAEEKIKKLSKLAREQFEELEEEKQTQKRMIRRKKKQ